MDALDPHEPLPVAPADAGPGFRLLPMVLLAGVALVAMSLILGLPITVLLLWPARDSGMQGHALTLRGPGVFLYPLAVLVPAIVIATWGVTAAWRGPRAQAKRARMLLVAALLALGLHLVALWSVGRNIERYASGGGGSPPCVHRLKVLAMSAFLYAREHGGKYPDSFTEILAGGSFPPSILVCTWLDHPEQEPIVDGMRSSFVYLGKGRRNPIDPGSVLMYERPGIHFGQKGAYVAFGDGYVQWVDDLQSLLARSPATMPAPRNP